MLRRSAEVDGATLPRVTLPVTAGGRSPPLKIRRGFYPLYQPSEGCILHITIPLVISNQLLNRKQEG